MSRHPVPNWRQQWNPPPPKSLRTHAAYFEGREAWAYSQCVEPTDTPPCPYSRRDGRAMCWWAGWYDCRINHNLGHIFEKYGIEYP
jgi:hypothetical protein